MADGSVNRPPVDHEKFHFQKKFVGAYNDSENFITLDEWVKQAHLIEDSESMLQIDIEGFEYETFLNISSKLMKRFRIIAAEFHDLHLLWSLPFFKVASRVFEKILLTHKTVHIHPNNCCGIFDFKGISIPRVMEFTFLRNDRFIYEEPIINYPHKLDCDNTSNPSIILPKCWYDKSTT